MILIHAFAQKMRNGMPNPKTYPHWPELLALLGEKNVVQIGLPGDQVLVKDFRAGLTFAAIHGLVEEAQYWISVDSFLPHLAHHVPKHGVVLWSLSDPAIFGYEENLNLLKDRAYLRAKQFRVWEEQSCVPDAWLEPDEIVARIREWRKLKLVERVA